MKLNLMIFFTKTPKIPLYIQLFILKYGSNSNCHKIIPFHSLHLAPKQDYLHFIHFHSFPFFYFKTSNQGYLIPFHSIPFFSIHFLYLNTFHSIPLFSIPFPSLMNCQAKPKSIRSRAIHHVLLVSMDSPKQNPS